MTFSPEGGVWIGVEVVTDSAANVDRFDNLEVASRAVRFNDISATHRQPRTRPPGPVRQP